jgi:hypothetical protein
MSLGDDDFRGKVVRVNDTRVCVFPSYRSLCGHCGVVTIDVNLTMPVQ